MPRDRAPDGIEPLVGYRVWRVGATNAWPYGVNHPLLLAMGGGGAWWPRRWNQATCLVREGRLHVPAAPDNEAHWAPADLCTCGLYACKSIRLALAMVRLPVDVHAVAGKVHLAGRIVEHELGYRAEYGKVVELYMVGSGSTLLDAVAAAYDVPVVRGVIREPLSPTVRTFARTPPAAAPGPGRSSVISVSRHRVRAVMRDLLLGLAMLAGCVAGFFYEMQGAPLGNDAALASVLLFTCAAIVSPRRPPSGPEGNRPRHAHWETRWGRSLSIRTAAGGPVLGWPGTR